MRALVDPRPQPTTARGGDLGDDDLAAVYAFPPGRPWVRANMLTSLDGAVGGADGRSASLHTPADNRVFALLRDLCDAVLVGAGTARTEGYRRVPSTPGSPTPATLVLVTRSGRVPEALLAPVAGSGDCLVLTCDAAGADTLRSLRGRLGTDGVLVCGGAEVDLVDAVARLAARGLTGVLCEGGPSLLSAALAQGVVDELALTLAPTVVGGDASRLVAGPLLGGAGGVSMRLHALLEDDGTLLALWRTNRDG